MSSQQDNNAWMRAWRMRCCPPDVELYAGNKSDMLHNHLQICPWCRADKAGMLSTASPGKFRTGNFPQKHPRIGELWLVNPELGGWADKSRYYNGPVVLVIDDSDEKTVNVLQIYDDDYFKGPEDVTMVLDAHHDADDQLPAGFAEPWNRYAISRDDLTVRLGQVTNDVVDKCLAAVAVPSMEIEEGSLLWFFRSMEVETGFYFARQSIANIIHNSETEMTRKTPTRKISAALHSISADTLVLQLRKHQLQCDTSLPKDARVLDILASCRLPDERLPLAASDNDMSVFALVFVVGSGKLESYTTCTFKLLQTDVDGNSLMVSGILPEEAVDFDEFYCWWENDGKMIYPDEDTTGFAGRGFWATFSQAEPVKSQEKYKIIIRCIKYL